MSSHLADLSPGERVEAELDGAHMVKVDIIARHRGATLVEKRRLESGHLLVTLEKE